VNIGVDLEPGYAKALMGRLQQDSHIPWHFVLDPQPSEHIFLYITHRLDHSYPVQRTVILVDGPAENAAQIDRLQRFSYVRSEILHRLGGLVEEVKKEIPRFCCVVCPGSEEKRNGVALSLATVMAERVNRLAYVNTEGVDLNDVMLDSPMNEGFTKLFLQSSEQSALSCFAYHHAHGFYYLGSAKSRRDKRKLSLLRWQDAMKRMGKEDCFDWMVVELSQEWSEVEEWLLEQAIGIIWVRGDTLYEQSKERQMVSLLMRDAPELLSKRIPLDIYSFASGAFAYQKTQLGLDFTVSQPGRMALLQLVDDLLERMMEIE